METILRNQYHALPLLDGGELDTTVSNVRSLLSFPLGVLQLGEARETTRSGT